MRRRGRKPRLYVLLFPQWDLWGTKDREYLCIVDSSYLNTTRRSDVTQQMIPRSHRSILNLSAYPRTDAQHLFVNQKKVDEVISHASSIPPSRNQNEKELTANHWLFFFKRNKTSHESLLTSDA
jgi:hypothetical protein